MYTSYLMEWVFLDSNPMVEWVQKFWVKILISSLRIYLLEYKTMLTSGMMNTVKAITINSTLAKNQYVVAIPTCFETGR